jgi:hypothetical protein
MNAPPPERAHFWVQYDTEAVCFKGRVKEQETLSEVIASLEALRPLLPLRQFCDLAMEAGDDS